MYGVSWFRVWGVGIEGWVWGQGSTRFGVQGFFKEYSDEISPHGVPLGV